MTGMLKDCGAANWFVYEDGQVMVFADERWMTPEQFFRWLERK